VGEVPSPPGEVQTPGVALDGEHTVGPPIVIGNLAVFPVYARVMEDLGDFLPLDDALEKGVAQVREVGAGGEPDQRGENAQVNTLVIENKGDLPILVLAGTVVKGGKQDRQIGQDFIIGKRQTVPVDAFCVEHGRWNASRNGVATGGTFKSLKSLAVADVRQAGQYQQEQGQVWARVQLSNRTTGKENASDTLTALLEAPEVQAEAGRVGGQVHEFLASVPMADRTVGLAYAVGGEVQGARWFIHHKLFARYSETLVNTAVADSFRAQAVARVAGKQAPPGACAPDKVAAFVSGAGRGREESRKAGENVNVYNFSDEALSSEAKMKSRSPAAPAKAVTKDFLKKQY
jgi:hypothetical protein